MEKTIGGIARELGFDCRSRGVIGGCGGRGCGARLDFWHFENMVSSLKKLAVSNAHIAHGA
jgi:hypothetical protein